MKKSSQLISFSVDPQETALYACYRDGKLRRWDTLTGNTKAVTILPPEKQLSIIIRGEQKEGIITAESFKFLRRGADKLELSGYTPLKAGMRLLDLCGDAVLFELSNELYLMNIIDNTVIYQHETDGRYKACLLNSSTIVFRSAKGGLELINALKSESSCTVIPTEQPVNSIFAVAFSENDGIIAATVSPISPEA